MRTRDYQIKQLVRCFRGYRCDTAPSPSNALNTELLHQPLNRTVCHGHRFSLKLLPHRPRAVIAMVLLPDALDLRRELLVALCSRTAPLGMLLKCFVMMIAGWCNQPFFPDWLDTKSIAIVIDESHQHFGLRPRSTWAKMQLPCAVLH